jgi:hypothetical protein
LQAAGPSARVCPAALGLEGASLEARKLQPEVPPAESLAASVQRPTVAASQWEKREASLRSGRLRWEEAQREEAQCPPAVWVAALAAEREAKRAAGRLQVLAGVSRGDQRGAAQVVPASQSKLRWVRRGSEARPFLRGPAEPSPAARSPAQSPESV